MGETNSIYISDDDLQQWVEEMVQEEEFSSKAELFTKGLCLLRDVRKENMYYVSAEIEDQELASWVKMKHSEGEFYNQEHVIQTALKRMKANDKGNKLV